MGGTTDAQQARHRRAVLGALASHLRADGGEAAPLAAIAAAAAAESQPDPPAPAPALRAVVVAGARTPFVKSFGKLIHLDAIGLAVASVTGLLGSLEPQLDPETIDEVVFGNVVVKSAAPNIARELVLDAGLPKHISGTTVICQCLSGLECVAQAARLIETADASCVIAGGSDSTSSGEIALDRSLSTVLGEYVMGGGNKKGMAGVMKLLRGVASATKLPQQPSIAERSTGQTMGYHADLMAEINGVERPDQDAWAIASHTKASAARSAGLLAQEIVGVPSADGGAMIEEDELIREGMAVEQLARLKAVFRKEGVAEAGLDGVDGSGAGTVTAASSSALTDVASAVLVMEESAAIAAGYNADVVVSAYVKTAVDPYPQLLLAPALAIPACLEKAGLQLEDIDVFEIHEAFAAQVRGGERERPLFVRHFLMKHDLIYQDRLGTNVRTIQGLMFVRRYIMI